MAQDGKFLAHCTLYVELCNQIEREDIILAGMVKLYDEDSNEVKAQGARVATLEKLMESSKNAILKG